MHTETFEYLTDVYPERELQMRLDELGRVGWELITAKWEEYSYGGRTHHQARCILKRRIPVTTADDVESHHQLRPTFEALGIS